MRNLICWLKGHDIEQEFCRAPTYEYWRLNKDTYKYDQKDIVADLNFVEFWCYRCSRYVSK